jgi:SAM-dependent methyltransferase
VLDYDKEAAAYDATRGGEPRAEAAAGAIRTLLPSDRERIVDLACGTGIVTARLGPRVVGIDRSPGMAAIAAARIPGRVVIGDVTGLPLASRSMDAVVMIWLLHLLGPAESAGAIAEAARVLRPGGVLISTVDKSEAAYRDDDDAARLIRPLRQATEPAPTDAADRVRDIAAGHGLEPAGTATFRGFGQGMSPHRRREHLRSRVPWTKAAGERRMQNLDEALAALPGQHVPRPDPEYTLLALTRRA